MCTTLTSVFCHILQRSHHCTFSSQLAACKSQNPCLVVYFIWRLFKSMTILQSHTFDAWCSIMLPLMSQNGYFSCCVEKINEIRELSSLHDMEQQRSALRKVCKLVKLDRTIIYSRVEREKEGYVIYMSEIQLVNNPRIQATSTCFSKTVLVICYTSQIVKSSLEKVAACASGRFITLCYFPLAFSRSGRSAIKTRIGNQKKNLMEFLPFYSQTRLKYPFIFLLTLRNWTFGQGYAGMELK